MLLSLVIRTVGFMEHSNNKSLARTLINLPYLMGIIRRSWMARILVSSMGPLVLFRRAILPALDPEFFFLKRKDKTLSLHQRLSSHLFESEMQVIDRISAARKEAQRENPVLYLT